MSDHVFDADLDLARPLQAATRAKGMPFDVVYGPTPVPATIGGTRVQMFVDLSSGDMFGPARSQRPNPRQYAVQAVSMVVHVFAKATTGGAARHDHERLANAIVQQVYVELHKLVRNAPSEWRITRAGFVTDPALTDGWAGVVYELRFQVDVGIVDVSWTEDAAGTGTFAHALTTLDTTGSPAPTMDLPSATTEVT
jgi:hypothetical protein